MMDQDLKHCVQFYANDRAMERWILCQKYVIYKSKYVIYELLFFVYQ
jgi:hypothetical protein